LGSNSNTSPRPSAWGDVTILERELALTRMSLVNVFEEIRGSIAPLLVELRRIVWGAKTSDVLSGPNHQHRLIGQSSKAKATTSKTPLACIVKVTEASKSNYLVLLAVFSPKSRSVDQEVYSEQDLPVAVKWLEAP